MNPNIQHFLISSVVPTINAKIDALDQSNILFLNHDHFDDLKLYVEPPESIGVDRLVNALAVQKKWNGNVVIVDIGSCVTFCRVKMNGEYLGGVIAPGFQMIRNALYSGAEQLPLVDFPSSEPQLVGTSTESAMHSGLFYGSIHLINGIIDEIKRDDPKASVVLTGGVPALLVSHINHDVFDPDLQFTGLEILFKKYVKN